MAARIAQRDELMSSSRIMHALWRWLLADDSHRISGSQGPKAAPVLRHLYH